MQIIEIPDAEAKTNLYSDAVSAQVKEHATTFLQAFLPHFKPSDQANVRLLVEDWLANYALVDYHCNIEDV